MRSLFKYLLGLVGLLTLGQGALAASMQATEMPHLTSRLTATAEYVEFVSDAYATPHVWHAHATALGIFQFEAVELAEEGTRCQILQRPCPDAGLGRPARTIAGQPA